MIKFLIRKDDEIQKKSKKKRLRVNYKESKRLGLTKGFICKVKKVQGLN